MTADARFNITIQRGKGGEDITSMIAAHEAVDGWYPGIQDDAVNEGKPITDLTNLTPEVAGVCLSQIVDQGHEWGDDEEGAFLHGEAARVLNAGGGTFALPDGWWVTLEPVT